MEKIETDMFAVLECDGFYIYVHKETKVMYLWKNEGRAGGLTVMLDENGKPLLWEEE